ncbi:LOW QUALITY PROTEIN: MLX-interacting protein-like [Ptychodera flava]|uniref:LOW QUALITY PROTEIN: MLX-interacting protein-like n=1 Tax=Ptychodera flava TaxID=63121 RepID=UPI003969EE3E
MTGIRKRDPKTEITAEKPGGNADDTSRTLENRRNRSVPAALSTIIAGQGMDSDQSQTAQEKKGSTAESDTSVDPSIVNLFGRMTVGFRSKLVSPRPKPFRGSRLSWKEKIRLNNGIWRAWHMQYIKSKIPIIGTFVEPLTAAEHSSRPSWQPDILDGKFWKQKLETTVNDYRKWRMYAAKGEKNVFQFQTWEAQLEEEDTSTPHPPPSPCRASHLSCDDIPLPRRDFEDTLFSSLKREHFEFPKPKELAKKTQNADVIQPGLMQLQPDFDFMETLESLQVSSMQTILLPISAYLSSPFSSLFSLLPLSRTVTVPGLNCDILSSSKSPPSGSFLFSSGFPDTVLQRQNEQPLVHHASAVQGLTDAQGGRDSPMQVTTDGAGVRFQGVIDGIAPVTQSGFQAITTIQQQRQPSQQQIAQTLFPSFREGEASLDGLKFNQVLMDEDDEDNKPLMFSAGPLESDTQFSMVLEEPMVTSQTGHQSDHLTIVTAGTNIQQANMVTMVTTPTMENDIVTMVSSQSQQPGMLPMQWVSSTLPEQANVVNTVSNTSGHSYNHSAVSSHHSTPASSRSSSRPHSRHQSLTNEPSQQAELTKAISKFMQLQQQQDQPYKAQQMLLSSNRFHNLQYNINNTTTISSSSHTNHTRIITTTVPAQALASPSPGGHLNFSRQNSSFSTPNSPFTPSPYNTSQSSPYNTTQSSPYNTNQSSPYNTAQSSPAPSPHLSRRSSIDLTQVKHSTSMEQIGLTAGMDHGQMTPPPYMEPMQISSEHDQQLRHSTGMEHHQFQHGSLEASANSSPSSYGRTTPESPSMDTFTLQSPRQKVGRSVDRSRSHPSSKATSPIAEIPFKFPSGQKQEHISSQYIKSEAKGHRKLSAQSVRERDAMATCVPGSASGQASNASSGASSPVSYQDAQSQENFEFTQPKAKRHKKTTMDENERVERRRMKHRTSEIKRRSNIQGGLEELSSLVGLSNPETDSRVSLAGMLQKSTEHIERLKRDLEKQRDDSKKMKRQIETLKQEISEVQERLPDSGVPVRTQSSDDALQEMLERHIQKETEKNWKYYMFGLIQQEIFKSYQRRLESATEGELDEVIETWMEKDCKLSKIRSAVTTGLTTLSMKTDVLEDDPSMLPEQSQAAAANLLKEGKEKRREQKKERKEAPS